MSKQRQRFDPTGTHRTSPARGSRSGRRGCPTAFWDRIKFVVLLTGLWACGLAVVWTTTVKPIGGPFSDAVRIAMHDYSWILVLLGLEVLRQLHYLIEEHSKAYYALLAEDGCSAGPRDRMSTMDDWTRFRAARAFKLAIFLFWPELRPGTHLQDGPRLAGAARGARTPDRRAARSCSS